MTIRVDLSASIDSNRPSSTVLLTTWPSVCGVGRRGGYGVATQGGLSSDSDREREEEESGAEPDRPGDGDDDDNDGDSHSNASTTTDNSSSNGGEEAGAECCYASDCHYASCHASEGCYVVKGSSRLM